MSAPLEPFAELVAREDARIDLAHACLLIAEDAYTGLDIADYLAEFERLAQRLRTRLPQAHTAEEKVIALNAFLFEDLGFTGNVEAYYDPRNSYLNEVMDRRTGIPISLSIVYIELGRRIGLPLEGVSFPGHFLVRLRVRGGVLMLDPFAGGAPQSVDELRERVARVIPPEVTGGVPVEDLPLDQFIEPASNRQILARVLRNLKGIYRESDAPAQRLDVLNRMLVLNPRSRSDLRDRGLVYQRLECWRPALQDLTDYLELEPDAADLADIRARVIALRGLCARLN
ncbi:MAG: tetratricopeptide repeat protein [Proteobacteria bacterium]|nr:tetratricopeptide repeat protein [Pseudomonadota bacterium]